MIFCITKVQYHMARAGGGFYYVETFWFTSLLLSFSMFYVPVEARSLCAVLLNTS